MAKAQSSPRKSNKGSYSSRPYSNKKKAKPSGKRTNHRGYPEHNMLLHRLSAQPSGTLLGRIGGSDRIDGGVSETLVDADSCSDSFFPADQHVYTPDSSEVERFLQSVISSSPSGSDHAPSENTPADHRQVKVEDTSASVLSSPTQLSSSLTLAQSPSMDDRVPTPATIEGCKNLLSPVLVASMQARDPGERLDPAQCLHLLSDDHCNDLIQKAKETRRQLSSLLSQETPVYRGSLKRDRVHEVDTWVRNTRTRFSSANTTVPDVSKRDSDITLVDGAAVSRSPPKAPRAMLQASQSNYLASAQESIIARPTAEDPPASLFHKALERFPTLKPAMSDIDTTNAPESIPPAQMLSLVQAAPSSSTDFVSHLPTSPGTWFRQQGGRSAEIVDVDFEVSSDMFYLSAERQPSRVRMALRLCSVPVGAMMNVDSTSDIINDAITRHTCEWPKKGKLVVQVNPEDERQKTWLPHTLESDPLDVTSCLRPGKNVFRFIQLSDLSGFMFVLVASPPPPEEAWRSWDWASLTSSHARSSTDDSMNGLSEFAQIRVTVRS